MSDTELATVTEVNAIAVFEQDGMEALIKEIEDKVKGIVFDIKTPKGRSDCISMAAKVSSSMAHIEKKGVELKAPHLEAGKVIDKNRKLAKDRLSYLRDATRLPVTEWENEEKDRVKRLTDTIEKMVIRGDRAHFKWMTLPLDAMKQGLLDINAVDPSEKKWGDLAEEAQIAKENALTKVENGIAMREKYIKDQDDLAELKKKDEEREQKDRDARMRKEGEEKAALDAKETEERLEREKNDALKREEAAERNAEEILRKAEEDRVAREKQKVIDDKHAEKYAKEQAIGAAKAERERIENERLQEEADAKKREANKKHREGINDLAIDAFVRVGLSKDAAIQAVDAISGGSVPNVTIRY